MLSDTASLICMITGCGILDTELLIHFLLVLHDLQLKPVPLRLIAFINYNGLLRSYMESCDHENAENFVHYEKNFVVVFLLNQFFFGIVIASR